MKKVLLSYFIILLTGCGEVNLQFQNLDIFPSTGIRVTVNSSGYINANNQNNFNVSGECTEEGQPVHIQVSGLVADPVCYVGSYSINMDLSSLADSQSLTVAVEHKDIGAENMDMASAPLKKDTAVPFVSTPAFSPITDLNVSNYSISGGCDQDADEVLVKIDGNTLTSAICSGGIFNLTGVDLTGFSMSDGTKTIEFYSSDEAGNSFGPLTDSVTVNINEAPVISFACALSLTQEDVYGCAVTATDPDGDPLTYNVGINHDCSWLSIDGAGNLSGIPHDGDVGTCTLHVQVSDGSLADDYQNTISIANLAPTLAISTPPSLAEDSPQTIVRTDTDVYTIDEGYGTYSLGTATLPKCSDHGSVVVNSLNGEIKFTPQVNFDQYCYIKVDFIDSNLSATSDEFMLTMTPSQDPPSLSASCSPNATQDLAYSCAPSATDPDTGDTLTWSLDGANSCGWISINPSTGAVSGTPADDDLPGCNLAIKVTDGSTNSDVYGPIAISITNIAPTLAILDASAINEDSGPQVVRADADVQASEEGYGIYQVVAAGTSPDCNDNGSVTIAATTGEVTYAPSADFDQTCYIKIQFDDGNGGVVNDVFRVPITPVNDPPVISHSCLSTATQGTPYSCSPIVNDVDTGDTHTWTLDPGSNTCSWALMSSSSGQITGTPPSATDCNLAFKVTDGGALFDTEIIALTVGAAVNTAPTLDLSGCPSSLSQDSGLSCTAVGADAELDTLSYSMPVGNTCAWASVDGSTGVLSGTPQNDDVGPCTLMVTVSDGQTVTTDQISFTVNNVVPTLTIPDATAINEDSGLQVVRTDADVQASEEGFGVYQAIASVTSPDCRSNGTVSVVSSTGEVTYSPTADFDQSCYIRIKFDDGNGGVIADEFLVPITSLNDPPVLSESCSTTATQNSAYNCTASVNDVDTGDSHTWQLLSNASYCDWATISSSGVITGTPTTATNCTLYIQVTDSGGATDSSNVGLTVDASVSVSFSINGIRGGSDVTYDNLQTDNSGVPVEVSWQSVPSAIQYDVDIDNISSCTVNA
ncbi:MAG: hypothetical protein KDD50_12315, partial [Bdellovibrionales bacterium]|nr:hypothetical protein [Bdellovibrionales bacterium]